MRTSRVLRPAALALLSLTAATSLTACGNEPEADTQAWATAIEAVPGVTSAEVGFSTYTNGEEADVDVYTETDDPVELERILRESIREFVRASEEMSVFGIDFEVWRADRTAGLNPASIGWEDLTIESLRDEVAAEG